MKKLIIVMVAGVLLISCATRREQATIDYWLNRSKAELIREWGPPASSSSYGHGIEVLSYNRYSTYSIPAFGQPSTQGINKFKQVYISSEGVIYYVH